MAGGGADEAFEGGSTSAPYVLPKMKAAPTVANASSAPQLGAIATKARASSGKVASECATLMLKAMRTFKVEGGPKRGACF